MFFKLDELLNTIMRATCGTTSSSFEFTYKGIFHTLNWKYDIKSLIEAYGKLLNHMMEWIRIWIILEVKDAITKKTLPINLDVH